MEGTIVGAGSGVKDGVTVADVSTRTTGAAVADGQPVGSSGGGSAVSHAHNPKETTALTTNNRIRRSLEANPSFMRRCKTLLATFIVVITELRIPIAKRSADILHIAIIKSLPPNLSKTTPSQPIIKISVISGSDVPPNPQLKHASPSKSASPCSTTPTTWRYAFPHPAAEPASATSASSKSGAAWMHSIPPTSLKTSFAKTTA